MTNTRDLSARLGSHPAAGPAEERCGMSHTPLLPSGGASRAERTGLPGAMPAGPGAGGAVAGL